MIGGQIAPRQKSCRLLRGLDNDDGRKNLPILSDDADCGGSVGKKVQGKKDETLALEGQMYRRPEVLPSTV